MQFATLHCDNFKFTLKSGSRSAKHKNGIPLFKGAYQDDSDLTLNRDDDHLGVFSPMPQS